MHYFVNPATGILRAHDEVDLGEDGLDAMYQDKEIIPGKRRRTDANHQSLLVAESLAMTWFTIEFIVRYKVTSLFFFDNIEFVNYNGSFSSPHFEGLFESFEGLFQYKSLYTSEQN